MRPRLAEKIGVPAVSPDLEQERKRDAQSSSGQRSADGEGTEARGGSCMSGRTKCIGGLFATAFGRLALEACLAFLGSPPLPLLVTNVTGASLSLSSSGAWRASGRWANLTEKVWYEFVERQYSASLPNYFYNATSCGVIGVKFGGHWKASFRHVAWLGSDVAGAGDAGEHFAFIPPSGREMRSLLTNRTIVIIGDSLGEEEYISLALATYFRHDDERTALYKKTINGTLLLVDEKHGVILGHHRNEMGPVTNNVSSTRPVEGCYYINASGHRRGCEGPGTIYLDLDKLHFGNDTLLADLAFQQLGTVLILNFGMWFRLYRSDVVIRRGGKRLSTREVRLHAVGDVAAFFAKKLSINLKEGNIAIWHGASPFHPEDNETCRNQTEASRIIYQAVRPFLGKQQVFMDVGCPLQSLPRAYSDKSTHFFLPGSPDVQTWYVARLIALLDPPRRPHALNLSLGKQ